MSANKELLNGTALDEWVRSFALRMGHDVKLSVRVWLQLYRRPSETLPKPPPAKATASESRPATILMVVPDAGVSFWVQQWNTQGALGLPNHVPCFPLPGIAGNAVNWPLVNRTVAAWRSSGGVMVAGFGRLLHVFASKATATGQVGRAKHAVVCLEPCAALSCAHATHPRLEHCRQARLDLKPTLLTVDEAHLAAKFSCSVGGQKVVLSKFLMVVAAEARLLITGALLSRQGVCTWAPADTDFGVFCAHNTYATGAGVPAGGSKAQRKALSAMCELASQQGRPVSAVQLQGRIIRRDWPALCATLRLRGLRLLACRLPWRLTSMQVSSVLRGTSRKRLPRPLCALLMPPPSPRCGPGPLSNAFSTRVRRAGAL